jgi:hypothetical protein
MSNSAYNKVLPPRVVNQFRRVIDANNHLRKDGKKESSESTQVTRANRIMGAIADLWALGFRIQKPESLSAKHTAALMSLWDRQGDSAGLLHTKLADLRTFASWVGKGEETVAHISVYLPNERTRRTVATKVNKSWEANGVDPDELIKKAYALDERFGAILDAGRHFGLRAKEAILLKPAKALTADKDAINVVDGTKGGFARLIPFRDVDQCHCIDRLVKIASKSRVGTLAWPDLTWKQAQSRFYYLMWKIGATKAQLGVTMHGQRAGYTFIEYKYETGYRTPIEGGLPLEEGKPDKIDRELHKRGALRVALNTGHRRIPVGGYYYGSYGHGLRPTKAELARKEGLLTKGKVEAEGGSLPGWSVFVAGAPLSFQSVPRQTIVYNGHTMHWPF